MFLDPQQIVVRNSIQVEPKLYEKSSTEVDLDCKKSHRKVVEIFGKIGYRKKRVFLPKCYYRQVLHATRKKQK